MAPHLWLPTLPLPLPLRLRLRLRLRLGLGLPQLTFLFMRGHARVRGRVSLLLPNYLGYA